MAEKYKNLTEEGKRRIKSRMTGGDSTGILFPEVYSGKKEKRIEAKDGGSMSSNHEQLTGWGNVRTDVKKFGKK